MKSAQPNTRRPSLVSLSLTLLMAATLVLGCFGSSGTDEGGNNYCEQNPENC
jgi:hypothetical protein